MLIKYPITSESHQEVMRQLVERRAQNAKNEEEVE
jgi:Na+/melibiose symporter-like transporter